MYRSKGELDSALDAYCQGFLEFEEHRDLFVAPINAVEAGKKTAEKARSRRMLNKKLIVSLFNFFCYILSLNTSNFASNTIRRVN